MKKMKHIKGIKGIREFLNGRAYDNGWHLFINGEYKDFYNMDVFDISDWLGRTYGEHTLLGWTGNGIYFTNDATVTEWNWA